MQRDRVVDDAAELVLERLGRPGEVGLVADVPVAPGAHLAALDEQGVAREQLGDVAEQRPVADRVLEDQVLGERLGVGRDLGEEGEERLHLGREREVAAGRGEVEGLDAEPVPGREEPLAVPEREGEHPAEVVDAVDAPARRTRPGSPRCRSRCGTATSSRAPGAARRSCRSRRCAPRRCRRCRRRAGGPRGTRR